MPFRSCETGPKRSTFGGDGCRFCFGFVTGNQAGIRCGAVEMRASTIGVVGALGAGFAPFLGGLARSTIGVDRLMSFTAAMYLVTGMISLYGILRHFKRDKIHD
jgi:hypothetical protein